MFKPAKIETRRGRIPVSEEARREARAGMGGEQTALAAATPAVPAAPVAAEIAPEPPAPVAEVAPAPVEVAKAVVASVAPAAVVPAEAPARRPRAAKAAVAPVAATDLEQEQEHSVKLSRSVVQQIKLTLALLPRASDNPANIKQYLEMAHRLLDAQLRKAGKLPPTSNPGA